MLPLDRFNEFITGHNLFQEGDRILLAVSGGRDSVLMAHFFQQSKINFGIAHCNFMLRGQEAMEDERFCRDLAQQLTVQFHQTRFETAEFAIERRISIQMAARDLRFEWLEQIRQKHDYDYIATAHHQNDAVETVLLNLVRGTGIAGLHGILPKRDRIIRPLLFLTRQEVDLLIHENRISYRDDASNFSSKYARNKIRLEVIPVLKELNPDLEATFESNSRRFAELEALLKEKAETVSRELITIKEDLIFLPVREVRSLTAVRTVLFEVLKPYGFTEPVIGDLIRSLDGQPGSRFESHSHSLILDREHLIIGTRQDHTPSDVAIGREDNRIRWNNMELGISTSDSPDKPDPSAKKAVVDAELLDFPLTVRKWKIGDFFHPLGMKGRKKLSDFFISQKVPLIRKDRIPVVVNGNGEIIWVAGMRLDDRYKVTPNTKKVYIFELK
jgi:tRNA(Ile)-lysidine synthase